MSQVVMCDRCKAIGVQVVMVVGSDLCNRCISDLKTWVRTGPRVDGSAPERLPRKRRTPNGQPLRTAMSIIDEHGEVTPWTYGAVTSQDYRHAYYTLNYLTRCGALARVRKPGGIISFVRAAAEDAE